jgi:C-methyltransferase
MTPLADPSALVALAFAHAAARALHVVADLGVADHLDREPREAKALAAELAVDEDALSRLLRLLESHGLFVRTAAGQWIHNEQSRLLRSDHPMSLRAFARMAGSPFGWASFTELHHATRTGEAGLCALEPGGWVRYLEAHPDDAETFHQAMTAKAHGEVAAALAGHDFSQHRRVADVGGGHGHLIRAVLATHPETSGVLFELPEVAALAVPDDRLEVVAGDFFRDPLPSCDAYVLMNVIHDWDDEQAAHILAAVAAAGSAQKATVLLLEVVLPDSPTGHWAKTLDIVMLAITGGRERTLAEYDALLTGAGMQLQRVTPTATPFSLLEARVL